MCENLSGEKVNGHNKNGDTYIIAKCQHKQNYKHFVFERSEIGVKKSANKKRSNVSSIETHISDIQHW